MGSTKYFCVSTDKAANPVNMMGASKLIMEMFLMRESFSQNISSSISSSNSVWTIEKWLVGKLMDFAGNPKIRIRFWDGQIHYPVPDFESGPILTVNNRRTLWHFFLNPNLHFGDGYSMGTFSCPG